MVDARLEKSPSMVTSTTKYAPLEHDGLEVAYQSDAPEVVPPSVNRKSSLLQPEPFHAAPYEKQERWSQYGPAEESAPQYDPSRTSWFTPDSKQAAVAEQEIEGHSEERRYCGLRRRILLALIVAVILVVIIAAVLGGVLGTVLPKKYPYPIAK